MALTKRSPFGRPGGNAAGPVVNLGIDPVHVNVLPKGSRSPGPTGLVGALLNQQPVVMKQKPGAGLVGGGISGLGIDSKTNPAAEPAMNFKSAQIPKQNFMRPQSFGLQSVLPSASIPPPNYHSYPSEHQLPENQLPNQGMRAKMNDMRSPRRQITVTIGGV